MLTLLFDLFAIPPVAIYPRCRGLSREIFSFWRLLFTVWAEVKSIMQMLCEKSSSGRPAGTAH